MTIPPMPAYEVPIAPTPMPEPECVGRHVKRESVISTKLRDDMTKMSVRAGLVVPHVPRHRADEQVVDRGLPPLVLKNCDCMTSCPCQPADTRGDHATKVTA